ncbi:MAG: four helix bundle protein [Deltaproteobacteria bacterium]|nr:four helix bundle protein [Deltaproteobacteria bacterium]
MNPTTTGSRFRAYATALDALRLTRAPLAAIAAIDSGHADQLRRASLSVVLNLAEGARRRGRDRTHFFRIAAGSAAEARAALDAAAALGLIAESDAAAAWAQFDAVLAMLWPLTR